jgi:hypothetical protein
MVDSQIGIGGCESGGIGHERHDGREEREGGSGGVREDGFVEKRKGGFGSIYLFSAISPRTTISGTELKKPGRQISHFTGATQ